MKLLSDEEHIAMRSTVEGKYVILIGAVLLIASLYKWTIFSVSQEGLSCRERILWGITPANDSIFIPADSITSFSIYSFKSQIAKRPKTVYGITVHKSDKRTARVPNRYLSFFTEIKAQHKIDLITQALTDSTYRRIKPKEWPFAIMGALFMVIGYIKSWYDGAA